jgi:hypothetical protein
MPGDTTWRRTHLKPPPFDVAMSVASRGFNYYDVYLTSDSLRALHAPVRTDEFIGDHQWSPEPVMAQALGWLEARAMARGLRPVDRSFVDSVFAVDTAAARALESDGRRGQAVLAWRNVAASWQGMHDIAPVTTHLGELMNRPDVGHWIRERDSLERQMPAEQQLLARPLARLRRQPGVPDIRQLTEDMRIVPLRQWSADTSDSVRAAWATRALAGVYVQVSFYEPEEYLAVGDPDRALAVLTIADEIHHDAPAICRERARAYALRRDAERTISELRCAINGHAVTVDQVRADREYAFLQANDAFLDLLHIPR